MPLTVGEKIKPRGGEREEMNKGVKRYRLLVIK